MYYAQLCDSCSAVTTTSIEWALSGHKTHSRRLGVSKSSQAFLHVSNLPIFLYTIKWPLHQQHQMDSAASSTNWGNAINSDGLNATPCLTEATDEMSAMRISQSSHIFITPSTTCLKIRQQRIHLLQSSLVVMGIKILGGNQMFSPPTLISLQERPYRTVVVELITVLSFTFKQSYQKPKMMCRWWGCNFLTSPSSPPSQPHSMRQQTGWPPSNGHLLTMKEPHHHSSITQWRGCFLPDITTPCMAWPAWCVITPASKRGHTEQW